MAVGCYMRLFSVLLFVAQGARSVERTTLLTDNSELTSDRDVCEPHTDNWIWNKNEWDDKKLVDRFVYKQGSTLTRATWIDANHCLFAFGKGAKSCTYMWYKLSARVRKFGSCGKIPKNEKSELAELVWGEGHHNLKDFLQTVITHMSNGLNQNSHVKSWLAPGNCTMNFDVIRDSTKRHATEMKDAPSDDLAEAILDDVFGPECKPTEVAGLKSYREKMKKAIATTVQDARDGNIDAVVDREKEQTKFEDVEGHELDTNGNADSHDLDKPASILQQVFQEVGDLGESLADMGMQASKGDFVKLLAWILLFCFTGPIALIVALIVYIVNDPYRMLP